MQWAAGSPTATADGEIRFRRDTLKVLSITYNGNIATVTTAANHGFQWDEMVNIAGVEFDFLTETSLGERANTVYNGTFRVLPHASDPKVFSYAMRGLPYSVASSSDMQCWAENERFDVLVRQLSEYCVVHLGVGVFITKGYCLSTHGSGCWTKKGQKFLGAGRAATTLKIQSPAKSVQKTFALHLQQEVSDSDFFEAVDFTIDCNVDGQFSPSCNCNAVYHGGSHIYFRHLRAINYGSRGPKGNAVDAYSEGFTYIAGGKYILFDDCIGEQASPWSFWNSTVLMIGTATGGKIRNCYVDERIVYSRRSNIKAISASGNLVSVETITPHGLSYPGNVSVGGVLVSQGSPARQSWRNRFNGVFAVTKIISEFKFEYECYAADALYLKELDGSPQSGPGARIGVPTTSHKLDLNWDVASPAGNPRNRFIAKMHRSQWLPVTSRPHNFTVNNWLHFGNIFLTYYTQLNPSGLELSYLSDLNPCNGFNKVSSVTSKLDLEFTTRFDAPASTQAYRFSGGPNGIHLPCGVMGNALSAADMGTGAVIEANVFSNGAVGGPWHDFNSTLDLVARNNGYVVCQGCLSCRQVIGWG